MTSEYRFSQVCAIDWSGAVGERHAGIAVALARVDATAPWLVRPGHRWSRAEVLRWLERELPDGTLVGLDLGMSLPFADAGAFFPGWPDSPADARALWALVDRLCAADAHLGAAGLVDHPLLSAYFRRPRGPEGRREGALFGQGGRPGGRGRLRVAERAQAAMGLNPVSNFNLVGAAQVGKSSLTGMRVLHRLGPALAVWPFDPLPERGSAVVEIYTSLAARAAGRRPGRSKIRDEAALEAALRTLGSPPVRPEAPLSEHAADALVTAAWLRDAARDPRLWRPAGMTPEVARTEGWTFGVA